MSDHSIVRRRIAALEEAIATIEREWSETSGAGPISAYTDRLAVDTAKFCEGSHEGAPWATVSDATRMLQALLGDLVAMGEHVERHTMEHGATEWRAA